MNKRVLLCLALLLALAASIPGLLRLGSRLPSGPRDAASQASARPTGSGAASDSLAGRLGHPASILFLQLVVILAVARGIGLVFAKLGQPAVIGEMVAGILLGPSLLGAAAPAVHSFLFPQDSLGALKLLSELGVILFMFLVGVDLDLEHLRQKGEAALLVSQAGIIVSLTCGIALSLVLYPALAPAGVSFTGFALFIGIAMSITAFPVLARILAERSLTRTPLGSMALACAAADDAMAWCMLAVVVAAVGAQHPGEALTTLALTVLFAAVMIGALKPLLARQARQGRWDAAGGKTLLAAVLCFVLTCAFLTEIIGIHALFGAFLAGVVLPRGEGLRRFLRERLESFSGVFLLPLFFAFTGLRTQVGLLGSVQDWLLCALIIAAAILGKLGGSALAARAGGMGWRESLALGTLMNARGLVELIVLNIGYEMGILSPRAFTMMVLMALVTTCMTSPLLSALKTPPRPLC
jgi:Kef-type K+ transport system membrane component KefB